MRTRRSLWPACLAPLSLLAVLGCSGPGGSGSGDGGVRELALRETAAGSLAAVGQVNWYHYRAVEANNVLKVRCSSNTLRPDEELSLAVYEATPAGERVRLAGDHAAEGAQVPANLELNVYVDRPKDLYFAVRDFRDDEATGAPYRLSIDFAAQPDGDQTFSTAVPLTVGAGPGPEAVIGTVGDVDCYRFDVASSGVYGVGIDFAPFRGGTDVELVAEFYDGAGNRLDTLENGRQAHGQLLSYLEAGTHYLLVSDAGRDSFDAASPYRISVAAVACDEARGNDTAATATAAALDAGSGAHAVEGALAYRGDQDWYRFPVGQASAVGMKVLELTFEGTDPAATLPCRIELADEAGRVLLTHDYTGGSSPYRAEILAGEGDHTLVVREVQGRPVGEALPYRATLTVVDVDDPAEAAPGNDTIDTAQPLADGVWATGRIAYRGDEDWYALTATTDAPRILEVFLETDAAGAADLSLSVLRDGLIRKVYDPDGGDGPTRLKTSVYIPAGSPAGPVVYTFRVCDAQGDDGEPRVPYRLRASLRDVPSALPADPAAPGALYFGEVAERAASGSASVRLEQTALVKGQFAADTAFLRLDGPGVARTTAGGLTTLTFPWVGGYVDYQGDQDWFELDLGPLAQEGLPPDAHWYYDVKLELHVGGAGSPVEYIAKLYRDENQNRILVDRPGDSNGFFASLGDADTGVAPLDLATPDPGTAHAAWVGDAWQGRLYLSAGDFDFLDAAHPDDDWGYEAPYSFRLTLVYHPGVSSPP